jgi:pimeloyl-ACP methyl ester carboxylesterase
MSTYVLVHGAFHGGWCWRRVTDRLRAAGHEVHTPTLTACGERAHLLSPTVDLETHVADVLGVLHWEDLHDVILVAHSYGGMPVTGAASRAADRIAALCYLDALWPGDGQSVMDVVGGGAPADVTAPTGDGDHVIEVGPQFAAVMGLVEPDDIAWVSAKATPMPLRSQIQPVALGATAGIVAPTLYVACMAQRHAAAFDSSLQRARAHAADDPRVEVVEVDAPHDAMITHPQLVTDLLLGLAERAPERSVSANERT